MSEIRRIMGEAALLRNIQEPPMKYVLCRENSLADMITTPVRWRMLGGSSLSKYP